MPIFLFSLFFLWSFTSCSGLLSKTLPPAALTSFTMMEAPVIGTTLSEQKIKLGGFSGLTFLKEKDGAFYFEAITDRGPNVKGPEGNDQFFLLPEYGPRIVTLKADLTTKELSVVREVELKKKNGAKASGLPHNRAEENPKDVAGIYYSVDPEGLDPEALVADGEGGWWVADEYFPALIHFDREGRWTHALGPDEGLPRMYRERRTNTGFEGIAKFGNKLYGFMQGPLPQEKAPDDKNSRIVEIDLSTMKILAEYFYPFAEGNYKLSDALAIGPQKFLVLEQNGKTGRAGQKYIYLVTLDRPEGLAKKTLILDLKSTPFNDVEKVEGLALIDAHHLALILDNDFQVATAPDPKTATIPLKENPNRLLIVEIKDSMEPFTKLE